MISKHRIYAAGAVRRVGPRRTKTSKCCLYAIVVLAIASQAAELSAQQPYQTNNQFGQTALAVERLPQLTSRPPRPEPVEYGADPSSDLSGYQQSPAPRPLDETTTSPTATGGAESESSPSVLDENHLDDSQLEGSEIDWDLYFDLDSEPHTASGMRDFWGYRYAQGSMDWIVGNGDQFGMFSLNDDHYQRAGFESGFGVGLDFNFVSGPVQTEMPPRLYDFSIAYQCRRRIGVLGYDLAASVMASSDFEGSAREGIRYPAHAVGFLSVRPEAELVFGVDYLDRGDIKLLPVAGLIWIPNDDVRLELVFPRPRATFVLPMYFRPWCGSHSIVRLAQVEDRFYIAGDVGGGTWAVERWRIHDDLATYRDLRLSIGLECVNQSGSRSAFEVSYLFNRRLEFTSGNGNMNLDDTVMFRCIGSY